MKAIRHQLPQAQELCPETSAEDLIILSWTSGHLIQSKLHSVLLADLLVDVLWNFREGQLVV